MDDTTIAALDGLIRALKAFSKSIERGLHTGLYEGTGNTILKQYRALQAKAVQILPDDFYVQEVFTPEVPEDADDEQKNVQVRLVVDQLEDYLRSLLKNEADQRTQAGSDEDRLAGTSRELQEQILDITRKTLKRALAH